MGYLERCKPSLGVLSGAIAPLTTPNLETDLPELPKVRTIYLDIG